MANKLLIIGAGFSGAVLARELAEWLNFKIHIIEGRDHIGGNCHTARDQSTGVMLHCYGPHIFHTKSQAVWDYVNRFGYFRPYTNRVKAFTKRGIFPLPINLQTINQFYGENMSSDEAEVFVSSLAKPFNGDHKNFEELALATIGRELYDTFIYGYTKKQWGCEPRELPSSIFKRLPLRFTNDDNYYNDPYQGIPEDGYTAVIGRILDHPLIEVETGRSIEPAEIRSMQGDYHHIFFTGPLDEFFEHSLGRLSYRTVTFERIDAAGELQGCALMNYPELEVPYTRIHEHKFFTPWENHEKTVAFKEYSQETGPDDTPFYPKRLEHDKELFQRYRTLAEETTGLSFLGRLATYRYLDMDCVIKEALDFSILFADQIRSGQKPPIFPNIN